MEFPALANPLTDNRGLTEWVDMADHEGSVITKNGTVLEKDQWAAKRIGGGCFRLAVVPCGPGEASVYLQLVSMTLDELAHEAQAIEVDLMSSNIVAIKVGRGSTIPMAPRETRPMKASFGVLPFIYINGNPETINLPSSAELRAEMAGTMRGVSVPLPIKAAEFDAKRAEEAWHPAEEPAILWPEPPRVPGAVNASECKIK